MVGGANKRISLTRCARRLGVGIGLCPETTALLAVTVAIALSGCWLAAEWSKTPANKAVPAFEALFPTLERLGVATYTRFTFGDSAGCEYLADGHGMFSSDPGNSDCRPFDAPSPGPFDARGEFDLAALHAAYDRVGLGAEGISIDFNRDGTIQHGTFTADACITFSYRPKWIMLPDPIPGKLEPSAINSNWYQEDYCP